ncbi:MAG: 50S ribosomal protein L25 [bacterium]
MATIALKAKAREGVGKETAKKARQVGLIPGVLYGEGEEPLPLTVNSKEFYPVIHTKARENVILDLTIEGAGRGECKAIIRELQYHPVRRDIIHVDFQHISMTKEIVVKVPIMVLGEAVGVKSHGGILEYLLREVEVQCLPASIPDRVTVDVSELDIGDSLQVKHLTVEGVKLLTDPDASVVTVVAPTVVEEVKVEAPAEAAAAEGAAPAEGAAAEGEGEGEAKADKKDDKAKKEDKPEREKGGRRPEK